jgi:hypothetical protein
MTSSEARGRTKRAYELSRVRLGLVAALPVVPLVAVSVLACRRPDFTLPAGAALFVVTAWLRARGQAYARAIVPGFVSGAAPLVLPLALRTSGHCCIGGACWSGCMLACVAGGLLAGVGAGFFAAAERESRGAFLTSLLLVAGLVGVLGCVMAGLVGVVGMALALGTSAMGYLVARPAQ